jgi:predicted alpha-1,6-mannanase (GH76 family)
MKYLAAFMVPLLYVTPTFADYADDALTAIRTLQQKFYNFDTGLWDDLWWQSGNIVETLARLGLQDPSFKDVAVNIISNTYAKSANQFGYTAWKNDYYDDEGWWAMAWIASYDLTGDIKYLNTAKDLFEDMTGGWNTPCGGGIWWSKDREEIAAISNELFLNVGAHLANRVSGPEKEEYVNWSQMEWDWFAASGIINADGLINDGLDPATCKNDGKTTFTYNQGVVLAGLSELSRAGTGAESSAAYLSAANGIASSVLAHLLDPSGILTEPVASPSLDETSAQFKGAFVRGLSTLNEWVPQERYKSFLERNADAAWSQPKVDGGVIVDRWQGGSGRGDASSHASGIDVLVAAAIAG